jgi:outer membrane protein assembly factor BamA
LKGLTAVMIKYFLSLVLFFFTLNVFGQHDVPASVKSNSLKVDSSKQRDIVDVIKKVLHKDTAGPERKTPKKFIFSLLPSAGYSLSTGYAANLSSNVVFYTGDKKNVNISVISASGFIDSYNQRSFVNQSDIWFGDNKYDFTHDFRWLKYPGDTYGLGSYTNTNTINHINYNYVKFYPTLLRRVVSDYYVGFGYNLDYHTNMVEEGNMDGSLSDFKKYGLPYTTTSSGLNVSLLLDKRGNPVNPIGGGSYANVVFRQNFTFLGSNSHWESLIVDLRKYYHLPSSSNNVLALWSYNWFTFNGKTPYLDLPSTGWDPYGSSGRGYAEGRFRGKDMLYLEAEYRFGLTKNGLLGGVLFLNGQSFPEPTDDRFKKIIPAGGTGLRIKVNKHSNTNICIDYGFGIDGSRGFFVNLGEGF